MPVIAIVNRKGGSGKSTLATHLAAWCAHQGHAVMLGDVDRQQSSRNWLHKRSSSLPPIAPWAINQNVLRVPAGITHVILDTPGGLHGFDLARMIMFADAVIMPVCSSAFDRESAATCHAELMSLPRVISGRCKVVSIGMRVDENTESGEVLAQWAAKLNLPFLGVLRESPVYVESTERGMTLFDMAHSMANAAVQAGHFQVADAHTDDLQTDLQQWKPILEWLQPYLGAGAAATGKETSGGGSPNIAPQTAQTTSTPRQSEAATMSEAAAPLASRLLNSRQPAPVTRIGSPRVLDRVGGGGVLRGGTTTTAPNLMQAPPAQDAARPQDTDDDLAHIPAFLKLVKA
ncbi:cobyrinic acid a,c-diamide synthase [Hylemonella gracilis str. Niagara R]|uniref:Cobyrinic acid a,c-diamide synthase n=1 Tax=Hylemonella gracilis str. Niagara R TaxID=1458275 RepID=A0A016XGB5_9BURK|nr:ParA family protein [Hylemonella gracilis]EYC51119.1 cobyrinic acid a,c-diamide synthase [Hylemonella gracilis str. Niagara R]